MMLRQGWAFATSPHGESQTIFNPGISGVPDKRATASISGDCAAAGVNITKAQSVATRRKFMDGTMPRVISGSSPTGTPFGARTLARPLGVPAQGHAGHGHDLWHQRRRELINRIAVLAL